MPESFQGASPSSTTEQPDECWEAFVNAYPDYADLKKPTADTPQDAHCAWYVWKDCWNTRPVRESGGRFIIEQLENALGCFGAAITEGLYERMVEQEPEAGNLRDLLERRVLVAQSYITVAIEALAKTTGIQGEKP
jgi:hypothetical protein